MKDFKCLDCGFIKQFINRPIYHGCPICGAHCWREVTVELNTFNGREVKE